MLRLRADAYSLMLPYCPRSSRHGSINRPPTSAFQLDLSASTIDSHGLSTSQPREPVSVLEGYNAVSVR